MFITIATFYKNTHNGIVDVRDLRQWHGARRGQITRIEHYFEARGKTLISLTEFTRKRNSLIELVKEHEAI